MKIDNTERALIACRLFLLLGYIGATTVAAGLIQLFAGETSALSAVALIIFGALLSAASWRRARSVLEADRRVLAVAAHLARPFGALASTPTTR